MFLELITDSLIEPIHIDELKEHLRLSHGAEDAQISHYIKAARSWLERQLSLVCIEQEWRMTSHFIQAPSSIKIPITPLISILEVRAIVDDAGVTQAVDSTHYMIEYSLDYSKVIFRNSNLLHNAYGVEIDFKIGYGTAADAVPAPLKQAIILLASHWFEHREQSGGDYALSDMPQISALLQPYQKIRL